MNILLISYYDSLYLVCEDQVKSSASEYVSISQRIVDPKIVENLWKYTKKNTLSVDINDPRLYILERFSF